MYAKTGGKTLFELLSAVRRGEDPVELDNMFMGLGISSDSPVGSINSSGVKVTAGAQLRAASGVYTPSWNTVQASLANGNFADLAGWLATANLNPSYNPGLSNQTYTAGSLLRYNGYPENWLYTNPQYSSVTWNGNLDHANYHSMQTQVTLRPTHGLSLSATWTWSRNLGIRNVQDPRNRAVDFGLLNTHRTHAITTYGTYDLPFGPNRMLFSNVNPSVLGRIIGGWQLSWVHTMQTGRPGSFTARTSLWSNGTPQKVGEFDNNSGYVRWKHGARTGSFYNDGENNLYVNVKDPQCLDQSQVASGLASSCTLYAVALASDPTKIIFQNPLPGVRGNYDPSSIYTPITWNTDMAFTKAIRIAEGKSMQIRVDATNVWNHAQPTRGTFGSAGSRQVAPGDFFGNITIGSLTSSRELGYLDSKVGMRTFQAKIRFDF
jgi:hypothetical protein